MKFVPGLLDHCRGLRLIPTKVGIQDFRDVASASFLIMPSNAESAM